MGSRRAKSLLAVFFLLFSISAFGIDKSPSKECLQFMLDQGKSISKAANYCRGGVLLGCVKYLLKNTKKSLFRVTQYCKNTVNSECLNFVVHHRRARSITKPYIAVPYCKDDLKAGCLAYLMFEQGESFSKSVNICRTKVQVSCLKYVIEDLGKSYYRARNYCRE